MRMGTGRKRIEIEPITNTAKRRVTFSKRRQGLYKKLDQLRGKTGCEVFAVTFSSSGRPYAFGDANLADRFLMSRGGSRGDGGGCNVGDEELGLVGEGSDLSQLTAEMSEPQETRGLMVELSIGAGNFEPPLVDFPATDSGSGWDFGDSELGLFGQGLSLDEMMAKVNELQELRRMVIEQWNLAGEFAPPSMDFPATDYH